MKSTPDKAIPTIDEIDLELARLDKGKRTREYAYRIVSICIVVAALVALIATMWMPVLQVIGTSMDPTLVEGEVVLVSKVSTDIGRSDIISFYYNNRILIKRIIGMPGDIIDIDAEGNIYINGEYYDEPYLTSKSAGVSDLDFPYTVPQNSYFVMGDNRATSMDSRSSELGLVSSEKIIGKVALKVWPAKSFGWVE